MGARMRAERTRAVTATFLHAVFCTRRVCYESSCIAERAGTATHHHYRRYNLDYISNYKTFACMQVRARRRPQRALGRARAALPGPGTTSHHPQASPGPPAAVSLRRRGAPTVATSRPARAPKNGPQPIAPPGDLAATARASAAVLRAPRTPPTLLHALPPSPVCVTVSEKESKHVSESAPSKPPSRVAHWNLNSKQGQIYMDSFLVFSTQKEKVSCIWIHLYRCVMNETQFKGIIQKLYNRCTEDTTLYIVCVDGELAAQYARNIIVVNFVTLPLAFSVFIIS